MSDDTALQKIAERHGIKLLAQFGSTVVGRIHAGSDVDLAVLLERSDVSREGVLEIQEGLQRAFKGRTVDLAFINHADPLFLKKLLEHCRLLYGAPQELARLKLYAFKRYQDHRRFLELERRSVDRQVNRSAPTA